MQKLRLVMLLGWLSSAVHAGEQYAFLVGVGGYDEKELKSLPYARADILEFRDVLVESGVKPQNIVLMVDDLEKLPKSKPAGRFLPEAPKIREELSVLLPALDEDDSLIIALAGHGVQYKGDAEPYFCPADVKLKDKNTLISLAWLYKQLEFDPKTQTGCRARQRLLLVDACRNDPRTVVARTSGGPELESVTRPQLAPLPRGVVAIFSCAEGQQALEHDPLQHGVFFYHVLQAWRGQADGDGDRQLTLDEMIAYSKAKTQTYARLELRAPQTPRQQGFFDGTWVLRSLERRTLPRTFKSKSIGLEMVLVDAGQFQMGSPAGEKDRIAERETQHQVRITKPLYVGKYEVTQSEFQRVMGFNPSRFTSDKDAAKCPVEMVSWFDAVEFCNRLSAQEGAAPYFRLTNAQKEESSIKSADVTVLGGNGYRLLTEAEWEYACRAETTTPFHFGGVLNGNQANVDGNFPYGTETKGPYLEKTRAVGSYPANRWGLHDMHGNVREWCLDWYAADHASLGATDPVNLTSGTSRVVRGGSWLSFPRVARAAYRSGLSPESRNDLVGFRVSRTP